MYLTPPTPTPEVVATETGWIQIAPIEPDHFEASLTPATMTGPPTIGHIGRSKGLVSSISGMVAR
jgi:hypothetical protein